MARKNIYIVTGKPAVLGAEPAIRLVKATSRAQARNHVARDTYSVALPSQDELLAAGAKVKVEDATLELADA